MRGIGLATAFAATLLLPTVALADCTTPAPPRPGTGAARHDKPRAAKKRRQAEALQPQTPPRGGCGGDEDDLCLRPEDLARFIANRPSDD